MNFSHILDRLFPTKTIYAHCDIPCGVYDPHNAQMAAHTVLRMTRLIGELEAKTSPTLQDRANFVRCVKVKEKHGEMVEDELGTLENDYFKPEHFEKFPQLKNLLEETTKLSVKARQTVDEKLAEELVEKTLRIAEIFFQTKGVESLRVKSIYPTEGEIVTHK